MRQNATLNVHRFQRWNTPNLDDIDNLITALSQLKVQRAPNLSASILRLAKGGALYQQQKIAPDDILFASPERVLLHYKLLQPKQTRDYDKLLVILQRSREMLLDLALRKAPDIASLLLEIDQPTWEAHAGPVCGDGGRLTTLCDKVLADYSLETISTFPCTVLADILDLEACQHLLAEVMADMEWYTPSADQYTSASLMGALLRTLLAKQIDPDGNVLAFDFNAEKLEGLSYGGVEACVQAHLIERNAVVTPKFAALATWALKANFPAEFQPAHVPRDLAYRTSTQWVRYVQGVNIAEAVKPGSCAASDFQTLFGLQDKLRSDADQDVQLVAGAAQALPILLWARAQGVVERRPVAEYTREEAQQALERFIALEESIETASSRLSAPMPDRMARAKAELESRQIKLDRTYIPRHTAIGAPGPYVQNHLQHGRKALDLVASGKLSGEAPGWVLPPIYAGGAWHEAVERDYNLPDIHTTFERDFSAWRLGREDSSSLMLRWLLGNLCADDRERLGSGTLTLFTVRHIGPQTNEFSREARIGYQGFLIEGHYQDESFYYEVHPNSALIRRREDLTASFNTAEGWRVRAGRWQPFDWEAYLTGAAPKEDSFSEVVLDASQTLAPAAEDADPVRQLEAIAAFASNFAFRYHTAVYPQAKGQTVFDRVDPAYGLFKALVPFWSSVEDLYQGIVNRDGGQFFWGVVGATLDIASFWTAGVKAVTLAARLLKTSVQAGVSAALKSSQRVARQVVVELIKALDPIVGLGKLLVKGAPRLLKLGADVIVALRKGLNHLAKHFKPTSHLLRGLAIGKLTHLENLQYRTLFGQQGVVVYAEPGLFNSRAHYRVEAVSNQPFGPKLARISDKGAVGVVTQSALPIHSFDGHWVTMDPAPHVSKQWISWGDDLYLTWPGATFKRALGADGRAFLRRVRDLDHQPPLTKLHCRSRRNGDLSLCAPDTFANAAGQLAVPLSTGREAVPWFAGIKCSADASKRMVYQNRKWLVRGGRLTRQSGPLRVTAYKNHASAQVIGGNDLFKRIRIQGGVVDGIEDVREISAVTMLHRTTGQRHLITRVDRGIYYKGIIESGTESITLAKFRRNPDALGHGNDALSDNDYLVAIYEGAHDANVYINQHGIDVIKQDLDNIARAINEGQTPLIAPFLNGPFDLGTTVEQGALFCKYARTRFLHRLKELAVYKHPLTVATPLPVRQGIADTLNVIYRHSTRFNTANLLNGPFMARMTGSKNLAYLKLRFREGQQPSEQIFYSLSGFQRRNQGLPLSLERASLLRHPEQPWHMQGDALVAPDGAQYIDAQPTRPRRHDLPAVGEGEVLFLPDLSNAGRAAGAETNQRLLDSERNILRYLENKGMGFDQVASAEFFTRLPTCQSCTLLIEALSQKMPPGTFKLYEGPRR